MAKPRIIIADTDHSYIAPLQHKFIEEYFEKVDLEVITDVSFFEQFFSTPQSIDILIISECLYRSELKRHNIDNIFIMLEHESITKNSEINVNYLYKYTSVREIFNVITGKSSVFLRDDISYQKDSEIVLVCSASGGVGKTTVALGLCATLSKNYKRVLYINASRLQSFQTLLKNPNPINISEVYTKLALAREDAYHDIKKSIRNEGFSYIPPFRAATMSLGIEYYIYENIALSAKKSGDFDIIVIDAEPTFDENKTRLIDIADKVIIVTKQTKAAAYATRFLVSNINNIDEDKFVFVCNDYIADETNALILSDIACTVNISEYIKHISGYEQLSLIDLSNNNDIKKLAFLII